MSSRSLARPEVVALRSRATVRPRVARPAVVCAARDGRVAGNQAAALVSLTAAATSLAGPAFALVDEAAPSVPTVSVPTIDIDAAVGVAADIIRAAGSTVQQGLNYAGVGAGYAKQAYDVVAPVVKSAAETAAPYVKSAVTKVGEVAGPALQQAEPTIKSTLSDAEKALDLQTVLNQAKPATDAAKGALDTATPLVLKFVNFLTHTDAATLAQYGLGAGAIYFLGPVALGAAFGSFRGYAGDISPAGALDSVATDGNTYIIDLRSAREKETSGTPDLPVGQRLIELEYASMDDRRLRGQLRDVAALELQVTVLELSSLKKIGKGSSLLLLDRNGSASKAVAKELTRLGFRKALVISGGFNGWSAAKLRTKASSTVSRVEVLPPVFGSVSRAVQGTRKGTAKIPRGRALPSGR